MNFKIAALSLCIGLSGCATKDHIYNADGQCLTCFNNPFTGEALNHDGTNNKHMEVASDTPPQEESQPEATPAQSASYEMHQAKYNADLNVDVAFIALKEEFQFVSPDEVRKEMGSYADFKLRAADYEWKMIPSVSYTMGSARSIMGSNMNLLVTINKRTDTSSTVIVKYWPRDKSIDADAVGKHLISRVKKALAQ